MNIALDENMPQEGLEGPSEGRRALLGVPHPRTLDGALYEAYRAGYQYGREVGPYNGLIGGQGMYLMKQAFNARRRRFVTLPEVD